jgi:hypothetical protein
MEPVKLSASALSKLKQAQRNIHDILPELDKAEACGIECQQYRQLVADTQQRIESLLTYYGTGQQ